MLPVILHQEAGNIIGSTSTIIMQVVHPFLHASLRVVCSPHGVVDNTLSLYLLAGLIQILAALCDDLTPTLNHHHQQQKQQVATPQAAPTAAAASSSSNSSATEHFHCCRLLSSAVLHLLRFAYMSDRPAQLWWDTYLGPSVGPAVKLAAALQLVTDYSAPVPTAAAAAPAAAPAAAGGNVSAAAAGAAAGGGGGASGVVLRAGVAACDTAAANTPSAVSSSSRFDAWVDLWKEDSPVGYEPTSLSSILTHAVTNGLGYKGLVPPLSDVMALPAFQQLMCTLLASEVQYMHNAAAAAAAAAGSDPSSSSGRSGSAGHGMAPAAAAAAAAAAAVPGWHAELYAAVGLSEGVDLTPVLVVWGEEPAVSLVGLNVLFEMLQVGACILGLGGGEKMLRVNTVAIRHSFVWRGGEGRCCCVDGVSAAGGGWVCQGDQVRA
jgi:hypothetical protein